MKQGGGIAGVEIALQTAECNFLCFYGFCTAIITTLVLSACVAALKFHYCQHVGSTPCLDISNIASCDIHIHDKCLVLV